MRATTVEGTQSGGLVLLCLASWVVPGTGHLWLGRRQKGLIFLIALSLMFAIGLALQGRLFPFQLSDTVVCLEAFAELGMGVPSSSRPRWASAPATFVPSRTEYGNAFLIVAGLLNLLVVIDAFDVARGRK